MRLRIAIACTIVLFSAFLLLKTHSNLPIRAPKPLDLSAAEFARPGPAYEDSASRPDGSALADIPRETTCVTVPLYADHYRTVKMPQRGGKDPFAAPAGFNADGDGSGSRHARRRLLGSQPDLGVVPPRLPEYSRASAEAAEEAPLKNGEEDEPGSDSPIYRLQAVLSSPSGSGAIISVDGKAYVIGCGDELPGGYKVSSIDQASAVIKAGNTSLELKL